MVESSAVEEILGYRKIIDAKCKCSGFGFWPITNDKRHFCDVVTDCLSAGPSANESCSFLSFSSILARSWSILDSISVRRLSSADAVFSPLADTSDNHQTRVLKEFREDKLGQLLESL